MQHLKPIISVLLCTWVLNTSYSQFVFSYTGPETIPVDASCTAILDWGHPNTPQVFPTMPGQVIISWMIFSISGGYMIGDAVPAGETVTVFYQARDNMGNIALFGFNITFVDTIPPEFDPDSLPGDITISCGEVIPPPGIIFTDNCDTDMTFLSFEETGEADVCAGGIISRTWIATDPSGNTASHIQLVTVEADTVAPVITGFPQDGSAPCGIAIDAFGTWIAAQRVVFNAEDDGCGSVMLSDNAPPPSALLGVCGDIHVSFFAADSCGNISSVIATFRITNDVPPVITMPATDESVSCAGGDPVAALMMWLDNRGGAEAEDDCSIITWSYDPPEPVLDGICNEALVVTFIADDGCGNLAMTTASFFVTDTTAPVVIAPAQNRVVNCSFADPVDELIDWLESGGNAQVNDLCTHEDSISVHFTIGGTPLDIAGVIQALQDSIANGNCADGVIIDGFIWNNVSALLAVSFVFVDACDNSVSTSALFAITDALGPVFTSAPQDTVITCSGGALQDIFTEWYVSAGYATGTDDCGMVTFSGTPSFEEAWLQISQGLDTACSGGVFVEVAFAVHDFCGNTGAEILTSSFGVVDTLGPVLTSLPEDMIFLCDGALQEALVAWLDAVGGAEAEDPCGETQWMYLWEVGGDTLAGIPGEGPYPEIGSADCTGGLKVTFVASDNCNNSLAATASFYFTDTIAPVIMLDPEVFVSCDSIDIESLISVSDNCTVDPLITYSDVSLEVVCAHSMRILRTWFATDDCGNRTSATQRIHFTDDRPPEFEAPADTIVFCVQSGGPDAGFPVVTDNCDPDPHITYQDTVSGSGCNIEIVRRWFAADACGNVRTAVQHIVLIDTLPPVVEVSPADLLLECDITADNAILLDAWIADAGGAVLTDNCGTVRFFIALQGSYDIEDTLTWPGVPPVLPTLSCGDTAAVVAADLVYADACGNTGKESLQIILRDTQPPVVENCLSDTTIILPSGACEGEVTLSPPFVLDYCNAQVDSITLNTLVPVTSAMPGDSMIPVDPVILEFVIPVSPVFVIAPVTLFVELSNVDADEDTEFFSVLDENGQLVGVTTPVETECGTGSMQFVIDATTFNTWAQDGSVVFTLLPNIDPGGDAAINDICPSAFVSASLSFVTVSQDSLRYAYMLNDEDIQVLDTLEKITLSLYAGRHTFKWIITDCSENIAECITEIFMRDSDPPQITCPDHIVTETDETTGCSVPVPLYAPAVSDDCGIDHTAMTFRISGDTLTGFIAFDGADSVVVVLGIGNYTVEYRVADVSENTASCTFTISIVDSIPPEAVCQPGILFVHPSGLFPSVVTPDIIDGGSMDNCGIDTMIVIPSVFPCDSAGTEQIVQLIVIDRSGNTDTCTTVIRVEVQLLEPMYSVGICVTDTLKLFANVPPAPGNPYTFEWSGPNGFVSFLENPVIPNADSTHSGTYVLIVTGFGGCQSMGTVVVDVDAVRVPEINASPSSACEGVTIVLNASTYNEPVTYRWYRGTPPGGLLLGATPHPSFQDIPPLQGVYMYYVVVENANCVSNPSATALVEILSTPVATVQDAFIEVCEGEMFSLGTTSSGPGMTYLWTGPNGYTSTDQFPPVFVDVTSALAGIYTLIVTQGGCSSAPAITQVVIAPRPGIPIIQGDAVYCEGGSLILTVNNIQIADQFIWQSPSMNLISTIGNNLVINSITEAVEGNWTVVAMLGDCRSQSSEPFFVQVEETLPLTASNTGPICISSGDSVTLIVEIIPGVMYVWEGPGGFISTQPNPTIVGVPGIYTVTATSSSGCTAESSTQIMTEDPPGITALSNNAGACANGSQTLAFAVTVFPPDNGNFTYAWTGPGGWTSSLPNPVIPGLTSALNGTYTLVVSLGSCQSVPVSTIVQVSDAPAIPGITGDLLYCNGESISLTSTTVPGDSVLYIWNTPVGSIEQWNNPVLTLSNAAVLYSGAYSVVVHVGGCNSQPSESVQVVVAQALAKPVAQGPASVCQGDTIRLSTGVVPGAFYTWTGPGGFTSTIRNPMIFPAMTSASGAYRVVIQIGECISDTSDAIMVNVLPLPAIPVAEPVNVSVCLGDPQPLTLCLDGASLTPGASYTWYYQGAPVHAPVMSRCITLTDFNAFAGGTQFFTVGAVLNGCEAVGTGTVSVEMYDAPAIIADAGLDATVCIDDEVSLNAVAPATGTGYWSSPDAAILFDNPADPLSDIANLAEGENILVWTLDFAACLAYSSDTVIVTVVSTPEAVSDSVTIQFGQTTDIQVVLNDIITGPYTLLILPGGPMRGNALHQGMGVIRYSPNVGFVGTDVLAYELCSTICPDQCTVAEVVLRVGDENDCFIPSIFTPNGDGINDRFVIPCLVTDQFPANRLVIFNEWGGAVYEAKPYLNDWNGTRGGKDLPVATYFYMMDFGDGRPVQTGFLVLER